MDKLALVDILATAEPAEAAGELLLGWDPRPLEAAPGARQRREIWPDCPQHQVEGGHVQSKGVAKVAAVQPVAKLPKVEPFVQAHWLPVVPLLLLSVEPRLPRLAIGVQQVHHRRAPIVGRSGSGRGRRPDVSEHVVNGAHPSENGRSGAQRRCQERAGGDQQHIAAEAAPHCEFPVTSEFPASVATQIKNCLRASAKQSFGKCF